MAKNKQIKIPLSELDLSELESGTEFNWTFPTEDGEDIDVKLFLDEQNEEEF